MSTRDKSRLNSTPEGLWTTGGTTQRLRERTAGQTGVSILKPSQLGERCGRSVGAPTKPDNTCLVKATGSATVVPANSSGSYGEWASAFSLLQSQLHNCVAELDTERAVRTDRMHEIEKTLSGHVGELRAMILQLKKENEYLTDTVRALQRQATTVPACSSQILRSGRNGDAPDASVHQPAPTVARFTSLVDRVEALENAASLQQRLVEERHVRLDRTLREMVGTAVSVEVERIRRIAREAARDCTNECVRSHVSAMQETLKGEREHQHIVNSAASDAARGAVQQFHALEGDVQRRLLEMSATVTLMKQQQEQRELALKELETRVTQNISAVERSVESAHRELKNSIEANAKSIEAKAEATRLALESSLAERVLALQKEASSERVKAAHSLEMEGEREKEYQREVQNLVRRLEAADRSSETSQQHQRKLEGRLDDLRTVMEELQQQLSLGTKAAEAASEDASACKTRIRDALAISEEARAVAQESMACAQKTEDATREQLVRLGLQLKRLTAEQENNVSLVHQLNEKLEASEARLASTRVVVDELSERHKNTLMPMSAKVDALQRNIHEIYGPRMDDVGSTVAELKASVEQLQRSASSKLNSDARKMSDMRCEFTTEIQRKYDEIQQQVHEWRQECNSTTSALRNVVEGIIDTIKLHDQSLSRRDSSHTTSAQFVVLSERVRALEMVQEAIEGRVMSGNGVPGSAGATAAVDLSTASTASLGGGIQTAKSVDDSEQSVRNQSVELNQNEVARIEALIGDVRQKSSLALQQLRIEVGQMIQQCRDLHPEPRGAAEPEPPQAPPSMDHVNDTPNISKLIAAIEADVGLQEKLATALCSAFAPRTTTDGKLVRLDERMQRAEAELMELKMQTPQQSGQVEAGGLCLQDTPVGVGSLCQGGEDESNKLDVNALVQLLQTTMKQLCEEREARRKYEVSHETGETPSTTWPAVSSPDGKGRADSAPNVASGEPGLIDLKNSLENRIDTVEAMANDTVQSTADALDMLKESVERCVASFVEEVNASVYCNSAFTTSESTQDKINVNSLKSLDSVFLFLWQHQCGLQAAVQALQDGSLGTLDLLQHHEEQLTLLQSVKPVALHTASKLERLAAGLGLVLEEEEEEEANAETVNYEEEHEEGSADFDEDYAGSADEFHASCTV